MIPILVHEKTTAACEQFKVIASYKAGSTDAVLLSYSDDVETADTDTVSSLTRLRHVAEPADDHVEGGIYISPEFQLGQVYDGAADVMEDVILYRPVYVCVPHSPGSDVGNGHSPSGKGPASRDGQTPSPAQSRAVTTAASLEHVNGHSPGTKIKKIGRQKSAGQPLILDPPSPPPTAFSNHDSRESKPSSGVSAECHVNSSPPVALTSVVSTAVTSTTFSSVLTATSSSSSTTTSTVTAIKLHDAEMNSRVSETHIMTSQSSVTDSNVISHVVQDGNNAPVCNVNCHLQSTVTSDESFSSVAQSPNVTRTWIIHETEQLRVSQFAIVTHTSQKIIVIITLLLFF